MSINHSTPRLDRSLSYHKDRMEKPAHTHCILRVAWKKWREKRLTVLERKNMLLFFVLSHSLTHSLPYHFTFSRRTGSDLEDVCCRLFIINNLTAIEIELGVACFEVRRARRREWKRIQEADISGPKKLGPNKTVRKRFGTRNVCIGCVPRVVSSWNITTPSCTASCKDTYVEIQPLQWRKVRAHSRLDSHKLTSCSTAGTREGNWRQDRKVFVPDSANCFD